MHAKWERIKYLPNLPLGKNGERVTGSAEHIELSRKAATEGMVLIKNELNVLPLENGSKVALFGIGSADYVKGGGGSGDVYTAYTRNLCDGMEIKESEQKLSVYTPLNNFYRKEANRQYEEGVKIGKTTEPDIPDELLVQAINFADVAIISICRFSEEAHDRKGEHNDGDFYLTLAEQEMVKKVTDNFSKVVVVLNVGGMVDTTWFKDNDKIQSVLLAWQAGMEGGLAEADILCGDVCPSGKLTDTFASCFDDYPSSYNFNESEDYAEYTEDIFVGYRYFETIPGVCDKVNYPFGFGLSYTTFDLKCLGVKKIADEIKIKVIVENTGNIAGKEVVQVYYSAPQGKLGKSAKVLCAFCKTRELLPGETQICTMDFCISDMSSYDDTGKVQKAAYILEKGEYKIYVGTSVRQLEEVYTYSQNNTEVVCKLSSKMTPKKLSKRLLPDGSYVDVEMGEYEVSDVDVSNWPPRHDYFYDPIQKDSRGARPPENCQGGLLDVASGKMTLDEFIEFLPTEALIDLTGGRPDFGVSNTKAWGDNQKYHIPAAMTADGPAGVRINHGICIATTAWPCATLLACSWNLEIVEKIGVCGALEIKENNLAIWLAPAMNIHRSPLCGRNFEYYSEDPLVSGKMAAAMIKGIQSQRIAACAKHFCCNNKETNRMKSDSRVSERALREIYLKPFEIAVKESKPWAVMTAYNLVNGIYTSENKELITDILRGEWGYEGLVTTDWSNHAEQYCELLAGNDIRMPHGSGQRVLKALENGLITREDIIVNVKRILELLLKLD